MTLINVATKAINTMQTVCAHFELALVEELLLTFPAMIDDAHATDLTLLLEVSAIFNLDEFFDSTNPEIAF